VNSSFELIGPLPGANFGGRLSLPGEAGAQALIREAERAPDALPRALADSGGLLLLPGMQAMAEAPDLLARLSRRRAAYGASNGDTPLRSFSFTSSRCSRAYRGFSAGPESFLRCWGSTSLASSA